MKLYNTLLLIFSLLACKSMEQEKKVLKIADKNIYPNENIIIATHTEFAKEHYKIRIKHFKNNPLNENDIVFLGNSITEKGGNWGERFNNPKIKNRGIAGDTTDGVLERLGEITYYKPEKVFILIGINDLFREDTSSEYVFNNIIKIVKLIKKESPKTNIFVQTILPTNQKHLAAKINKTNALLANEQKSYQLILLHNAFLDNNGLMNNKLSEDGVHLNELGYKIWENKLKNII